MPTYQYRCTECGEELEAVQKFSDDALTVCPACQGPLRKVFTPVGIVFKGSGFYRTDSRKGSAADGAKKDKDKDKEPAAAKTGESGSADSAKSGAKESSSASESGTPGSGSGSGTSGSSGAKKEAKSSPSTSAPAATGS